jgi:hypothetical protein
VARSEAISLILERALYFRDCAPVGERFVSKIAPTAEAHKRRLKCVKVEAVAHALGVPLPRSRIEAGTSNGTGG